MTLHIETAISPRNGVEDAAPKAAQSVDQSAFETARADNAEKTGFTIVGYGPAGEAAVRLPEGPASGPLNTVGSGVMDSLDAVAQRRESLIDRAGRSPDEMAAAARDALLPGPASLRPEAAQAPSSGPDPLTTRETVSALARTFDYAIETHVVVKSISQFSNSANSLLKTQ